MSDLTNNQPLTDVSTFDLLKGDENDEGKTSGEDNLLPNKDVKGDEELESGEESKETDTEEDADDELKLDEEENLIDDKFGLIVPPKRKEILAAYPDLFKKFPYIDQSMYREKAYTDILGTVEDAKEAVEKAKQFDELNVKVKEGNVESILDSIDKEKFGDVVDNLMPSLFKKDQNAFFHIASGFAKSTIGNMIEQAKADQNEDLYKAAVEVHKFIYGNTNFVPHGRYGAAPRTEDTKQLTEIQKREQEFETKRLDTHKSEVDGKFENQIKSTIANNIDKHGEMTDYIKRNAIKDAVEKVNTILKQDTRFQTLIDKAWEKAAKANFPKKDVDEISSAKASKARTILLEVIKNSRNEALKGMGKQVRERVVQKEVQSSNNGEQRKVASNRNSNNEGKNKNASHGMSTLDYLNSD